MSAIDYSKLTDKELLKVYQRLLKVSDGIVFDKKWVKDQISDCSKEIIHRDIRV